MSILRSTLQLLFALLAIGFGVLILKLGAELGAAGAAEIGDTGFVLTRMSGWLASVGGVAMFGWLAAGVWKDQHGWLAVLISASVAAVAVAAYFLVPAANAPVPFVYSGAL